MQHHGHNSMRISHGYVVHGCGGGKNFGHGAWASRPRSGNHTLICYSVITLYYIHYIENISVESSFKCNENFQVMFIKNGKPCVSCTVKGLAWESLLISPATYFKFPPIPITYRKKPIKDLFHIIQAWIISSERLNFCSRDLLPRYSCSAKKTHNPPPPEILICVLF